MDQRILRKNEHLSHFLTTYDPTKPSAFADISFLPKATTAGDFFQCDLRSDFLGSMVKAPLYINAITGGSDEGMKINEALAGLARDFGIPMALGSMKIALQDERVKNSFTIARRTNPQGILLANLSAMSDIDEIKKAIDMIDANGIQLHLNAPQELVMKEGDRSFKGLLQHLEKIAKAVEHPIIVKEVGFGMTRQDVENLYQVGIRHIDVGGTGGTNFIAIEESRYKNTPSALTDWGISTPLSLLEAMEIKKNHSDVTLYASGGVRDGLMAAKALSIGAKATGIAGSLLHILMEKGRDDAYRFLENFLFEMKTTLSLLDISDVKELQKAPFLIKGFLYIDETQRVFELSTYANRYSLVFLYKAHPWED